MRDEMKVTLTRRAFAKTAAQVAVTTPAIAAVLSASTKPVSAASVYLGDDPSFSDNAAQGNPDTYPVGPADDLHIADDFGNPDPSGP